MKRSSLLLFLLAGFFIHWAMAAEPIGVPDRELIEYPDEEPPSEALVALGKTLFFDTRLSSNRKQSCATCHNPDLGYGDGQAKGLGTEGNRLERNTPHIYNLAWNVIFMWDGRAPSLEAQALGPIEAEVEMNMPLDQLLERLGSVPYYQRTFNAVFPDEGLTKENIGKAIAAFERTIIVDNTPFDRYMKGDLAAMSPSAIRGMHLFEGKARCTVCHDGPNFTNNAFHNIGIGDEDEGRDKIQPGPTARGAFKTPGLRNVLLTAPYMHDGSLVTLEEVVQHYNKGGNPVPDLDPAMKPLNLTDEEVMDVVTFMGALTQHINLKRPQIPPLTAEELSAMK